MGPYSPTSETRDANMQNKQEKFDEPAFQSGSPPDEDIQDESQIQSKKSSEKATDRLKASSNDDNMQRDQE